MSEREGRSVRGGGREREGERVIAAGPSGERGYATVEGGLQTTLGQIVDKLRSLEERLQALEARPAVLPTATSASPASWLGNLLQGVTLVSIIGFAFWL